MTGKKRDTPAQNRQGPGGMQAAVGGSVNRIGRKCNRNYCYEFQGVIGERTADRGGWPGWNAQALNSMESGKAIPNSKRWGLLDGLHHRTSPVPEICRAETSPSPAKQTMEPGAICRGPSIRKPPRLMSRVRALKSFPGAASIPASRTCILKGSCSATRRNFRRSSLIFPGRLSPLFSCGGICSCPLIY